MNAGGGKIVEQLYAGAFVLRIAGVGIRIRHGPVRPFERKRPRNGAVLLANVPHPLHHQAPILPHAEIRPEAFVPGVGIL